MSTLTDAQITLFEELSSALKEALKGRFTEQELAHIITRARDVHTTMCATSPHFEHELSRKLFALGPPTVALFKSILISCDQDKEEALALTRATLHKRYELLRCVGLRKVGATIMFHSGLMHTLLSKKSRREREENGFVFDMQERQPGDVAHMHVHSCPLAKFVHAQGVSEVGPLFCELDDLITQWAWGIDLEREGTIAQGKNHCDFRYHRKR